MNIDALLRALKMWQYANNHSHQVSLKCRRETWTLLWAQTSGHQAPRYEMGTAHQKFQSLQKQTGRKISEQIKECSFVRSAKYQMYADHCRHLYSGTTRSTQQKPMQSQPSASRPASWHCILFYHCPKYRSAGTLE